MLNKLAYRNVKRAVRDYLVYFMTMAVVTALMFSFNSLLFSKTVQDMFEVAGEMAVMTGIATVFIVLIVAWLINYMVRFILSKRSREFGIYLLIGMKKKEIAALYIKENVLLGTGAFLVGMGLGVLFEQVLLSIFYSMVQMDYHLRLEWNGSCILMTALCYSGCYLLALLRCKRKFKKMSIHDLMNAQRQNEEIKEKDTIRNCVFLPLSLAAFAVFGIFLFFYKNWQMGTVFIFIIMLVIMIYLFYTGLAACISRYVTQKRTGIYQKDHLFLLRQFSSKIRTMTFTMGTLTALFTLAILGSSVALMFNHFQNQVLVKNYPFDVQIHSSNAKDDFSQAIRLLKKEAAVKETCIYQIYENHDDQVNTYLYTHLKEFGNDYLQADGSPDCRKIAQNNNGTYCTYDTYMKLSDYNHLRHMIGLKPIQLQKNQYGIQMKERVFRQTGDFSGHLMIKGTQGRLSCAGYYTEGFSQNGHNGGDYIIIVPDEVTENMHPYYAELVADIRGKAPANLQNKLDNLDAYGNGKFCSGSDTIMVYIAQNLVKDNTIPEIKYLLSSIVFPMFYVGLVFLCVALTVLSVQQLSDSEKYKFRYRVLFQIGYSRKDISRSILKQLLSYYMCPVCVALLLSGIIAVYTGNRFNFYAGTHTSAVVYFLTSVALFLGIYMIYFILTYVGFKRNVQR